MSVGKPIFVGTITTRGEDVERIIAHTRDIPSGDLDELFDALDAMDKSFVGGAVVGPFVGRVLRVWRKVRSKND